MRQVVKRIFSHSQAKNSLSLKRKAFYWGNRAEFDDYNKESMPDTSEVRESSYAIKSNFFAGIKEPETDISISTSPPTPTK